MQAGCLHEDMKIWKQYMARHDKAMRVVKAFTKRPT